jgi:hypothetical protein
MNEGLRYTFILIVEDIAETLRCLGFLSRGFSRSVFLRSGCAASGNTGWMQILFDSILSFLIILLTCTICYHHLIGIPSA